MKIVQTYSDSSDSDVLSGTNLGDGVWMIGGVSGTKSLVGDRLRRGGVLWIVGKRSSLLIVRK